MSLAVGGQYEFIGQSEASCLRWLGPGPGMRVIDVGCGSGRMAWGLGQTTPDIDYLYLTEARQVAKPGGTVIFSFLESRYHRPIFRP